MCKDLAANYKSLRILYWNARSIFKRKHDLSALLKDFDIFLCVESWLKNEDEDDEGDPRKLKKPKQCLVPGFVQYQIIIFNIARFLLNFF